MAKFKKVSTCDGTLVLVPADFYDKILREIRGNPAGFYKTRMYIYWVNISGDVLRHPANMELIQAYLSDAVELVVSQTEFKPEVYFV